MKAHEYKSKFATKPIVYVDMDGVLADFFGEIARRHKVDYWREIHRQDIGIDQIAQEPGFFRQLPKMPNAMNFIKGLASIVPQYSILSSPLMSEVAQSTREKSQWLGQHLTNYPPKSVLFDHEKYRYAQQPNNTPNILIDDYETNIRLWNANGGIGILYKDENWKEALEDLKAGLEGKIKPNKIINGEELSEDFDEGDLYTAREVLRYVKGIHHEYHMPKPILQHDTWILKRVPVVDLKTPEFVHQDDPYRRVIDIDWDHVKEISVDDIIENPIVADAHGWVLDGNHRATAARYRGLDSVPALVPYSDK